MKTLTQLCDKVEKEHHALIRRNIAEIERLIIETVREDREGDYPFLNRVLTKFQVVADTLAMHIQQEEAIILPYIKKLDEAASRAGTLPEAHFPTLKIPVAFIDEEHGAALKGMGQIREYTGNYFLPKYANGKMRDLFAHLQKFEKALEEAFDLEERALFPLAIKLEAKINDKH